MIYKIPTVLLLLLVINSQVLAKNNVITLKTAIQDNSITITPLLSFKSSNQIKEAIDNGTRVQIIAKAQLYEPHTWWFNSEIDNKKSYFEISYFTLSKLYVIKNKETDEQLGFINYEQLWEEFEKLIAFKFNKPQNKNTWARFRIVLDTGALPTVMQLPVLLNSDWDIDTPWFNQKIDIQ